MTIDIVEQLEAQIIGNQASLCSSQKNIKDATRDFSIVDSLDLDDDSIDVESIDTTVASVAVSALMRNELTHGGTSTPKRPRPSPRPTLGLKRPLPSTSTQPPKGLKLNQAIEKVMNMTGTTCDTTSIDSDSESLFSQD